jgi:hypothetical protein
MMNIDAKSNLAKLLASENLFVEMRKTDTASFNLKTRVLTIPNLKSTLNNDVFDLFIGHEVGHALFTPFEGWHDSIVNNGVNKDILNVCEDSRIEKLIRRKFPGLKLSFLKAYRQLVEDDFFGTTQFGDLNQLNLIDRINLHQKCGVAMGIQFTPIEMTYVKELEACETFAQVIEVAKKIQQYMLEQAMDIEKRKSSGDVEYELSDEEGDTSSGKTINFDDLSAEMQDKLMEKIKSKTDEAFRDKEKSLQEFNNRERTIYANVPNFDLDNIIVDYKQIVSDVDTIVSDKNIIDKTKFSTFRNETLKVVSYLVKEFELRRNADQMKRASVSKTGEINMDKVYSYKFNEDLFKRMSVVPNGKSHGLVLFLDWSGSMTQVMLDTIKQLLTLALFCKKVQIPFEVYAFSDSGEWKKERHKAKVGDIKTNNFHLLNILSSRMNNPQFNTMANALLNRIWNWYSDYTNYDNTLVYRYQLGGTPLNESILAAMKIVPEFQQKSKLQIVNTVFLTDGEGHRLSAVISENGNYEYGQKVVIRDPKTKAQVVNSNTHETEPSEAFLKLLKQTTGCNVVGFRIASRRELRGFLDEYKIPNLETMTKEFGKNKSVVVPSKGFDEYYFLCSSSLDVDDGELDVTSTATRSLVKAFKNYNKSHFGSRVILNRFIKMIS